MNTEIINDIQNRIRTLEQELEAAKKQLTALKIDSKTSVKAEKPISPGMACKVAYNAAGLVYAGSPLDVSDIPDIPIDKVTGLRDLISSLPGRAELSRISSAFDSFTKKSIPAVSGCKVNVDDHGLVIDASPLLVEDIPELPVEKISGLAENLELIKASIPTVTEDRFSTIAGNGCKVFWDSKGRVTGGSELTMQDIPTQLTGRLQKIESRILNMASIDDINNIRDTVFSRLDAMQTDIKPGIYTKLTVSSTGQITGVSNLTKEDLPQLTVEDITGLDSVLLGKASTDDISIILDRITQLENTQPVSIQSSANVEIPEIRQELMELRSKIDQQVSLPVEQILAELNNLRNEVITLSGRISVIERELQA